mgnify:CR=1 FL=1
MTLVRCGLVTRSDDGYVSASFVRIVVTVSAIDGPPEFSHQLRRDGGV